jgi:hypothetical protein
MLEQHRIASRPRTRCDADAARAANKQDASLFRPSSRVLATRHCKRWGGKRIVFAYMPHAVQSLVLTALPQRIIKKLIIRANKTKERELREGLVKYLHCQSISPKCLLDNSRSRRAHCHSICSNKVSPLCAGQRRIVCRSW